MTDYLQANCICCGTITDVIDGSNDPAICVTCYDKGLGARSMRAARVKEARSRKAHGASVEEIIEAMHISRQTLWRWLHGRT